MKIIFNLININNPKLIEDITTIMIILLINHYIIKVNKVLDLRNLKLEININNKQL